jgi:MSHA pilin protein MshD
MCTNLSRSYGVPHPCQRGLTLIELIIFIVIVTVALTGVLVVLNITTKSSADPLVRKQMLTIAEGVLEEVQMQAFTWCDPNDPGAATATSAAGCTGGALGANDQLKLPLTFTVGETRASALSPFDNVADYNGAVISSTITGSAFPSGYSATVEVAQEALGGIAASAVLRISVTVNKGSETFLLEGYRARYAPNSLP